MNLLTLAYTFNAAGLPLSGAPGDAGPGAAPAGGLIRARQVSFSGHLLSAPSRMHLCCMFCRKIVPCPWQRCSCRTRVNEVLIAAIGFKTAREL